MVTNLVNKGTSEQSLIGYDRLLAFARGVTCGVGYDEQIVPDVPVESHDVKLNMVLSPSHTSGRVLASHKE